MLCIRYPALVERDIMAEDKNFKAWLAEVDVEVQAQIGLGFRDLADFPFRFAYDDGCDPASVALDVIASDDTFSMFL